MYLHRVLHILAGKLALPIKLLFYQHALVVHLAERKSPIACNSSLFELYGLSGASADPKCPHQSSFEELSP